MSRGIIYLTWKGEFDVSNVMVRALASVKHWHPELPVEVIEMPAGSNLLCKSEMYDRSPFEETLFLDADTTVMGRLDYGFQQAAKHGIACCVNANPWQRRYYRLPRDHDDTVEYSSGVVFFCKEWKRTICDRDYGEYFVSAQDVFIRWKNLSDGTQDTRSQFVGPNGVREMPVNDQALFSLAMQQLDFNPFVLPLNWNFYNKWQKDFWGEIKVWHGYYDIPEGLMKWNAEQRRNEAVIQCGRLP
jgi:hypothetical protein